MFDKKYTLLIISIFTINLLVGQDMDIKIEQHNTIQNVPVNSIVVDFNNNKWIGTEKGLYRIEDYSEETKVMKDYGILNAIMGENERGWVCTYDGKIAMFDKEVSYATTVSSNELITSMDVEGSNIWLGTTDGLYKVSLKSKQDNKHYTKSNSKLPSNRINDIYVGNDNQVWIGTEEGLMTIRNGKWISHLRKVNISAIEEHEGDIMAAGDGGLWKFKDAVWEELALPMEFSANPIEDMCYDENGNLWLVCGLLGRLDQDWIPYIYGEEDGFSSNHPISLKVDQRNNVWVGTAGEGLFVLKQPSQMPDQPIAFADKGVDEISEVVANAKNDNSNSILFSVPSDQDIDDKMEDKPVISTKTVINGRMVKPGNILEVNEKRTKIAVWNAQSSSDGDVVSLYYNNKLILKEFKLTRKRKIITLKVDNSAKNDLVLFAHTNNETAVKTVKVAMLHEDHPNKWITLNADSEYSDQVQFNYKSN
jgi:hypothetical protein